MVISSSTEVNAQEAVRPPLSSKVIWLFAAVVALIALFFNLYGVVAFVSFVVGIFVTICYYGYRQECVKASFLVDEIPCPVSKGLSSLVNACLEQNHRSNRSQDKQISGCQDIDDLLNDLLDYVVRDYVNVWYSRISDHSQFVDELKKTARILAKEISQRCRQTNWTTYISETLPELLGNHVRLYRRSLFRSTDSNDSLDHVFFKMELEMLGDDCCSREVICTQRKVELRYLRMLADTLLCILLPSQEYRCTPARILLSEIVVNFVLLPTIDLLSDPDYVNQNLIYFTPDEAYTYEYLLQSVSTSDTEEELDSLNSFVNMEMVKLRSQDTGGEADVVVKSQLNSLAYIKQKCTERRKVLNAADTESLCSQISTNEVSFKSTTSQHQPMYQMSFESVLKQDVALNCFIEYLSTVRGGADRFVYFHLNVEGYRLSTASILYNNHQGVGSRDLSSIRASIREQAQSIFSQYFVDGSSKLAMTDNGAVKRTQQRLNRDAVIDETIFDELQASVLRLLQQEQFFGRFKQSLFYQRLLDELDISREGSQEDATSLNDGMFDGVSPIIHSNNNLDILPLTITAQVIRHEIARDPHNDKFTNYVIQVRKLRGTALQQEYNVFRRYSEFNELHQSLVEKCEKLEHLNFPGKSTFKTMQPEFIERRGKDLDLYLQQALTFNYSDKYADARTLLLNFLESGSWQRNVLKSNLPNPLKMMRAMPENLLDGVKKNLLRVKSPEEMLSNSTDRFGATLDFEDQENLPLRIMLLVMDEIFDVKEKGKLFRKGIAAIIGKIIRAFFGDRVNKKIIEFSEMLTSSSKVCEYLVMLRNSLWPSGFPAATPPPRNRNIVMLTRLLCRAKMQGTISNELRQFLGNDITKRGVTRLFNMFQHTTLNRRLVYVLFDELLAIVFSEYDMQHSVSKLHYNLKKHS